jgi:hypothetical protein
VPCRPVSVVERVQLRPSRRARVVSRAPRHARALPARAEGARNGSSRRPSIRLDRGTDRQLTAGLKRTYRNNAGASIGSRAAGPPPGRCVRSTPRSFSEDRKPCQLTSGLIGRLARPVAVKVLDDQPDSSRSSSS